MSASSSRCSFDLWSGPEPDLLSTHQVRTHVAWTCAIVVHVVVQLVTGRPGPSASTRCLCKYVVLGLQCEPVRIQNYPAVHLEFSSECSVKDGAGTSELAATGAAAARRSTRPAVLFAASAALTRRMQSVFVPYFRYLIDPLVAALESSAHPGAPSRPSKRRKSAPVASDATAVPADPADEAVAWYTRLQVCHWAANHF